MYLIPVGVDIVDPCVFVRVRNNATQKNKNLLEIGDGRPAATSFSSASKSTFFFCTNN